MSDPYRVLQVSVSADAGEIRRSFHALIRKYHPDKTASGKTAVGESDAGADWFHEVTKAYRILSDPKLRREFDSKSTADTLTQAWPVSEELDLDDMEYLEEECLYSSPCRCGGCYVIREDDLEGGVEAVCCSSCTLSVRIWYQPAPPTSTGPPSLDSRPGPNPDPNSTRAKPDSIPDASPDANPPIPDPQS